MSIVHSKQKLSEKFVNVRNVNLLQKGGGDQRLNIKAVSVCRIAFENICVRHRISSPFEDGLCVSP
jgi:hypothetical protein